MVVEKNLVRRSSAVLIAVSMLTGLLVLVSDESAALPTDAWITGNVVDGSGPVPNTYVKVLMFTAGGVDINYSFTDVSGDYTIGVPGGFDYVVFVANGSYYMSMQPVTILTGETLWVNFTLDPVTDPTDVTIKGWVKDELGDPITTGHVLGLVNDPMGGDTPFYANVTEPDGSGYFEVNVIPGPAGGGAILMDYPGYSMVENSSDDPLEAGLTYWFNISLEFVPSEDTATVYGYVTDLSTGDPLMNALVTVDVWNESMGEGRSNYTFTDVDGYYELNVTDGWARVMISKGGYAMKMYENVEILPSDMLQFDAALAPTTCVVKGNVTDLKADVPLVFANVFMMDMGGNFSSAITNDTGYFELRCVDGDEIWVVAEVEGYSRNWTIVSLSPGDELWHDFGLWPVSSWIEGYVTDRMTGLPIEDAWVNVESSQYDESDNTDASGYYNISVVFGEYDVRIGAMDYRENETVVDVPDGVAVKHDVALLPWDLPETCVMYGWVNDTGGGIDSARVVVQMDDRSYYNETWTDVDGYYEMMVPPLELLYGVTAYQHYPDFGSYDFTGETDVRLDFLLDTDVWGPNITYTQDPVENITWFNPSVIDIEIEEPNLESFSLMQFMFWKTETTWEYFYAVDFQSTSFNPLDDPSGSIPYTQDGDNYTVHQEWNATGPGGWLSDGSTSIYLMAYEQWWGPDLIYALRGYYNNATIVDMGATALFDSETGELLMFWPDWWGEPVYAEDDPTATFDPAVLVFKFDVDDWGTMDSEWNTGAGEMDVTGLTFESDEIMPSGDYKTFLSVNDFGGQGNGRITNMTVDNDPPVADAGDDWNQPLGEDATLNATDSSDNVGIVSYVWDFEDDGVPVQRTGMVVDYEFTVLGPYDITLTVTDGAGHVDTDTVTMTLVDTTAPVANAGLDMMVPSGTTVTLNGSLSTDNVGIVSYTWTFDDDGPQSLDGIDVEYTFDNVDVITITLTVEDDAGNSDTDTITITVLDVTDPVADAGPDQMVPVGTEVTLDGSNSSDDAGVVSWEWTFEDGGEDVTLTGETETYTFENAGTYVVTLTVEDDAGNSDTDTVTIRVSSPPVADAGSPIVVTVGATVTFDGSGSSGDVDIENYTWTFSYDGSTQTLYGVAPSFTFEVAGNYTVTLTVEDAAGLTDTDTVLVTVNEEDDDEPAEDKSFLEEYWWLLAVIAAVVIVAAVAGAMMMSKKGKGGSPQAPPSEEPAEDLPPPPDDMDL